MWTGITPRPSVHPSWPRRTLYGRAGGSSMLTTRLPLGGEVAKPRATARRTRTTPSRTRRRTPSGPGALRCPDCDFVAKHAMGLGRHRSTRHGVVSQRQARRDAEGGWITRKEAARRAGVHYNTIRHWEQSGRVRTSRRGGRSGQLVSASDVARAGAPEGSAAGHDGARIQALEQRFDELLTGLERLVATARGPAGRRRQKR